MKKRITGSGGGKDSGGSSRVPVEKKDNLQSRAFARVIDLISEGEIGGLVDGLKSVYLDDTPVMSSSGKMNFAGYEYESRNGTQDQDYILGYTTVENEVAVGIEVVNTNLDSSGVVRTITNELIDAVRVRISMPQMTETSNKTGDIGGIEVKYRIELQSNGGGYQTVVTDTVNGKSTSKYERAYRVDLTGDGPWDIRVVRISPTETESRKQNRTFWESYTEIIDAKLRYPNSAMIASMVDSSQFDSVPRRGYDVKLLKIKIPSNATVRDNGSLEYTGVWDGDFQVAWSSNPAWVFYDLITNSRYGLGNFISEDLVDKWAIYQIGRYCDELVPDGKGGTEPRFTCNVYFQQRAEAYKVLQDLASSFQGMVYWAEGIITASQDSPSDAVHLFTQANVIDGMFNYSGSSAKSRHTVALITWNDPEDMYRQKTEYVEDAEGIARYGIIETDVVAFGCTSQGQAHRVGKWLLYSERYQTDVISFKTGIEGAICRPGQIIKVADPMRAGFRRGGRIVSATDTVITVDQDIIVDPGSATLSVMMPDGTVEERPVAIGEGRDITVSTPFSRAPTNPSVWIVSSNTIEAQWFRVTGIVEEEQGIFSINAVSHNPDKYALVEYGVELEPRNVSGLTVVPSAPINLQIVETLYAVGSDVRVKVTCAWNIVSGASSYVVQYKRDNGNVIVLPETSSNEIEVLNADPGEYTFTVYAVNSVGVRSSGSTASKTIRGRAAPPGSVENFSLMPLAGVAYLSWDKAIDLDVLIGGSVRIRYSPVTVDPQWRDAVDIVPALPGTATRVQAPLLEGTYLAKFIDSSGVASSIEALIVTTAPAALTVNVVETLTEHPTFAGAKQNMGILPLYDDGLGLASTVMIDSFLEMIDTIPSWDYLGGVELEGTYDFADTVDLGQIFTSRLTANIKVTAVDVTDNIDQRTELIDDWLDLDGEYIDDVNAEIFLRSTLDDPNDIDAEWTDWKRFFVGEYKARGYQFQLRAETAQASHNIVVNELSVTIDMPDRVEDIQDVVTAGSGATSITFTHAFKEPPAIGITMMNGASGDRYVITNRTATGFDIEILNSGGTTVSRTIDVLAKGYGRLSS